MGPRISLPHLRASGAGAVVNTCSIAAIAGLPQRVLDSASKGAVQSMTLAMAADHLREGIRVNCVNPGTADTPWIGRLLEKSDDPVAERAALEARQPHGRLVSADEVAAAIAYLASPAAGSTTGVALAVDGGCRACGCARSDPRAGLGRLGHLEHLGRTGLTAGVRGALVSGWAAPAAGRLSARTAPAHHRAGATASGPPGRRRRRPPR